MIRSFFLFLLMITFLAVGYPLDAPSPQEIDRRIQAAHSVAAYLEIETLLKKALQQAPDNHELSWRLAKTYFELGRRAGEGKSKNYFNLCLKQAERAVQLQSNSAFGYFFKGLCRGKLGEMKGILSSLGIIGPFKEDMEVALKLDPSVDHAGPHRALGKLYYELPFFLGGSLAKSIRHFKEAVRLSPDFGENYLFLAQAYYARSEYEPARDSLLRLLEVTRDAEQNPDILAVRAQGRQLLDEITPWLHAP